MCYVAGFKIVQTIILGDQKIENILSEIEVYAIGKTEY